MILELTRNIHNGNTILRVVPGCMEGDGWDLYLLLEQAFPTAPDHPSKRIVVCADGYENAVEFLN